MCIKSSSLSKENSSFSAEDALPIETDRLSTRVPFHFPIMMVRIQKQRGQTPVFFAIYGLDSPPKEKKSVENSPYNL